MIFKRFSLHRKNPELCNICEQKMLKGAATDMRYFARSKSSRSLVHKKNFSLIRQVVFKLEYTFCQER